MRVVHVKDGRVTTQDSVAIPRPVTGRELRDGYLHDIQDLTFGLVRDRGNAFYVGPLELLRFGSPTVTASAVEWPIEGGILARAVGGSFRIEASGARVVASVDGYRPRLPLPVYALSQLPVHRLLTRLYLLRVRGREPAPGVTAAPRDRIRAAAVDVAFCITLAGLAGRRRRLPILLGVAAAYHVACWSSSGRTLGGLVMRQRVVAVDGSRLTVMQSAFRLLTLPLAWVARRPIHDELAGTDVIVSEGP
jgi:RDD family